MIKERLTEFKILFDKFKSSESYKNRLDQFCFRKVAREIIIETLKHHNLTNEHLTGLVHMFKWDCSKENFSKYLEQNIIDDNRRNIISVALLGA